MKPLVSILIPAYNAETWIAETLQSAIAQTWERREIIVVDDGSIDGTVAVAKQFARHGVRVETQKNTGAAAARNRAFELCSGDYIQWLDADDVLVPTKVASQMKLVESGEGPRTLLSGPWGCFMHRSRTARFVPNPLWADLTPAEFMIRKLGQRVFMQTAVWLVSRELSESAGPWNTAMLSDDDGEYFCRVISACQQIKYVSEAQVLYRMVGTDRLSHVGASQAKINALWASMQIQIAHLRRLDDGDAARAACVRYLQSYFEMFFPKYEQIVHAMRLLAVELGGELYAPTMSRKYSWIVPIAGWDNAKRMQGSLLSLKWALMRRMDELAYRLENRIATNRYLPKPRDVEL